MSSGFDTKKFIQEVEKWPQLWNNKYRSSREEQYIAWHSVGEVIFSNWKLCPVEIREERVREMKTLWNNIQEKYFEETSTTKLKTKRESNYLKLLDFLKSKDTQKLVRKGSSVRKKKTTRAKKKKEESPQKSEDEDENPSGDDGDESFFRSLLPTVRSLNELQRMNFRLDILNSIKKIMLESSNSTRLKSPVIKSFRESRAKEI